MIHTKRYAIQRFSLIFALVVISPLVIAQGPLSASKLFSLHAIKDGIDVLIHGNLELKCADGTARVSVGAMQQDPVTQVTIDQKVYYKTNYPELNSYFQNTKVTAVSIKVTVNGFYSCDYLEIINANLNTGNYDGEACTPSGNTIGINSIQISDVYLSGILELKAAINKHEQNAGQNKELESLLNQAKNNFNTGNYKLAKETAGKGLAKSSDNSRFNQEFQTLYDKSNHKLNSSNSQNSKPETQNNHNSAEQQSSQNSGSIQNNIHPTTSSPHFNSSSPDYASQLKQQQDYINKTTDDLNKIVDKGVDQISRSYYQSQQLSTIGKDINNNRNLEGHFNSVEELEAEFDKKYLALTQAMNKYAAQQQDNYNSNMNYYNTQTSGIDKDLGVAVNGIASAISANQAAKDRKKAQQELIRQKERIEAEIKAEKLAMRQQMRKEIVSMFPEGSVPMTKHRLKINTVYLFFYSYNNDYLEQDHPVFAVSNIFTIDRYQDNTWPLESSIRKKFAKLPLKESTVLVGYYTAEEYAQEAKDAFMRMAKKSEISIDDLEYIGKINPKASGSSSDFWGVSVNQANTTNDTIPTPIPEKKADFWGAPVKTETITIKPDSTEKKKEENFWGKPIKG